MVKVLFAASSGGHLEQIMMLSPLMDEFDSCLVTEKTPYNVVETKKVKTFFVKQINRKEKRFLFSLFINCINSMYIFLKFRPNVIISTGALSTLPILILGKLLGRKVIFIESFAKVNTPTRTGQLVYKFADKFYVQWEEMLKVYPEAIYKGGLY